MFDRPSTSYLWTDTAPAAVRADPAGCVTSQGQVLRVRCSAEPPRRGGRGAGARPGLDDRHVHEPR
ncbi:hypothetical protein C1I99_25050 [Micromonospora deserti]|uniref:Uncharacterized protein n=1 Tax=Micromonospora deserti TaxID=2070366 RepID=A0A2W2BWF8_9ACTN|nr:hypothetical protein C1I99_25050 [Micromonospora deserti]